MTPAAADDLAHRICATWQRTAPPTEWADALEDLDEVSARQAFRRWRNEHREAPTIADIRAMVVATDQRRHAGTVTTPAPLDVDDESIVARMQAVPALIAEMRAGEARHDRELIGRVWRHSAQCRRCSALEARFWALAGR